MGTEITAIKRLKKLLQKGFYRYFVGLKMSSFWPKDFDISKGTSDICHLFHKNNCHTNWKIILLFWFDRKNYLMTIGLPFIFLKVPNKGGGIKNQESNSVFGKAAKRCDVSLPFTLLILPPPQFSEPFKIESIHTYASEASFFDQQLTQNPSARASLSIVNQLFNQIVKQIVFNS